MDIINQNVDDRKNQTEEKPKKNQKKISLDGNALCNSDNDFSNLFRKDTLISEQFSVLILDITRATLREASSFKKFMEESISEDGRNLIIDLNSCEFVDSSFFGVLVGGLKRMRAMGMKFYILFNSKNKLPIFSATGLDKVFKVFDNIEDAISS